MKRQKKTKRNVENVLTQSIIVYTLLAKWFSDNTFNYSSSSSFMLLLLSSVPFDLFQKKVFQSIFFFVFVKNSDGIRIDILYMVKAPKQKSVRLKYPMRSKRIFVVLMIRFCLVGTKPNDRKLKHGKQETR